MGFIGLLRKKQDDCREIAERMRRNLENAPEGNLWVSHERGNVRYYWNKKKKGDPPSKDDTDNNDEKTNKDTSTNKDEKSQRVYLKKDQEALIRALAQKDFECEVLRVAEKQKNLLQRFLQKYDPHAVYRIYSDLSEERKALVTAGVLDDQEYVQKWQSVSYPPGEFGPADPEFYTIKKERVRSKSEQIIADRLYMIGIPYRYEYPITLKDGRVIRPDFIILDIHTRTIYILEHFGRMDDPNYVNGNFLPKLRSYTRNGIFPGEQLLITAESSEHPFSTVDLDCLIREYLPMANIPD